MEEIKSCPFCGSADGDANKHEEGCFLRMILTCYKCGLIYRPKELKEAWNKRHYEALEENGYFILPKPNEELFTFSTEVVLNDAGKITLNERIDIIREALDKWRNELGQEMTQKLFETFRPTCEMTFIWADSEDGESYRCSKCGKSTFTHVMAPSFCSRCGAKVVWVRE